MSLTLHICCIADEEALPLPGMDVKSELPNCCAQSLPGVGGLSTEQGCCAVAGRGAERGPRLRLTRRANLVRACLAQLPPVHVAQAQAQRSSPGRCESRLGGAEPAAAGKAAFPLRVGAEGLLPPWFSPPWSPPGAAGWPSPARAPALSSRPACLSLPLPGPHKLAPVARGALLPY